MYPDNLWGTLFKMAMYCFPDVFFNLVVSIAFYKNGMPQGPSWGTTGMTENMTASSWIISISRFFNVGIR